MASLYLPTEVRGPATRQSPIRFKNLVKKALERLSQHNAASLSAKLKETCEPLFSEHEYWQHQTEGLGLLCDDDRCDFYHLPFAPPAGTYIGRRFHIKPLLEAVQRNRQFYVLALSLNQCRLFKGDIWSLQQVDVPNLPTSLAEALRFDDPERSLQFHSAGSEGGDQPMYHGQGSSADSSDHRTLRYFQACSRALDSYLQQGERNPLLLAAVDEHVPIYRQTTSNPDLVADRHIGGNPDDAAPSDLHKKAQMIVADLLESDLAQALEQAKNLKGTSRTCAGIEQIAMATVQGRVQDLFVAADETVPGTLDPTSGEVELGGESNGEITVDLLNEAAAEVLLHGGNTYVMPAEAIPSSTRSLAILRY